MSATRSPLGEATITLSFPSGLLRWVRYLHLLPYDGEDAADTRAQREERKAKEKQEAGAVLEKVYWTRRYNAALRFAADRPPFKRLNLPTEAL